MVSQPIFGTLGTFRFFLALCVMVSHIWLYNSPAANQAVMLFYMVSGYVVSIALDNRYLYSGEGLKNFYINRCLRIYPLYLAILLISVAVLFVYPTIGKLVDHRFYMAGTDFYSAINWLMNITLIGSTTYYGTLLKPQVIPAAWTVGVEMTYWVFMPLLMLYKPLRHILFIAMVAHLIYYVKLDMDVAPKVVWYGVRYYGLVSGILPFLIGMYIYEANKRNLPGIPTKAMPFILAAYAYCLTYNWLPVSSLKLEGLYLNVFFGGLVLYYLTRIDLRVKYPQLHDTDRLFGNLAYSVLLLHQLVAAILCHFFGFTCKSAELFVVTLPFTCAAALLTYTYIEKPVESLRAKFRKA